jgi:hypothetical protein
VAKYRIGDVMKLLYFLAGILALLSVLPALADEVPPDPVVMASG